MANQKNKDAVKALKLELNKKLKKSKEILRDQSFMDGVAKDLAKQIKTRARLGKSAEESGASRKLKSLSKSYVETRKKYKRNLSSETKPTRSNLTATGQMLDAIFGYFKNGKVVIDIKDERGASLTDDFQPGLTNRKLIDYNEQKGRRFWDVTKFEFAELERKIRDRIRNLLEK